MKKYTIVFALMLAYTLCHAQKGFHFGVDGTAKLPLIINQNTYGDPEYEYKSNIGYAAGITMGYHVLDFLGLYSGVQYTLQGQEYEDISINDEGVFRDVDLQYIRIPLYLQYSSVTEPVRFFADGGIYFGFLQDASIEYTVGVDDRSDDDATEKFEDGDFGLLLGTGAEIQFTDNLYLSSGLRFTYGLSDINAPNWRIANSDGIYEKSVNASLGVRIGVFYMIPAN